MRCLPCKVVSQAVRFKRCCRSLGENDPSGGAVCPRNLERQRVHCVEPRLHFVQHQPLHRYDALPCHARGARAVGPECSSARTHTVPHHPPLPPRSSSPHNGQQLPHSSMLCPLLPGLPMAKQPHLPGTHTSQQHHVGLHNFLQRRNRQVVNAHRPHLRNNTEQQSGGLTGFHMVGRAHSMPSKSGCHPLNAGCSLPAAQQATRPWPHERTEGMLATSQRAPSAVKPVYAGSKAVWCMRPLRKGSGEGGQQLVRQLLSVEQRRAVQPLQWAPQPHPILLPRPTPLLAHFVVLSVLKMSRSTPFGSCKPSSSCAVMLLRAEVMSTTNTGPAIEETIVRLHCRQPAAGCHGLSCLTGPAHACHRCTSRPAPTACPASQRHTPVTVAPAVLHPPQLYPHPHPPIHQPSHPPFRAWRSSRSTPAPAAYASAIKCPGLSTCVPVGA